MKIMKISTFLSKTVPLEKEYTHKKAGNL